MHGKVTYNIYQMSIKGSVIKVFVSAYTAQFVERWDDDLDIAGSSPMYAIICRLIMFVCWHILVKGGEPQWEWPKRNESNIGRLVWDNIIIWNVTLEWPSGKDGRLVIWRPCRIGGSNPTVD